jgi:putative SOS response-associated peptidase YedK
MRDKHPFGFAGLWERWEGEDGRVIESCTILTTEANELMSPIHDRMPVILHPDEYELWLDEDVRKQDLRLELLKPYEASEMTAYPVGFMVNSPRHEGVELVKALKVNSA